MGSVRLEGVRFSAYPQDHEPIHIHGAYAEVRVIVELNETTRTVEIAERNDAIKPGNASRSDVKHILNVATANFDKLIQLWKEAHA